MKALNSLLTREEQNVLAFIVVFATIGIGLHIFQITPFQAAEGEEPEFLDEDKEIRFDLNTASAEELMTVPGIGPKRAEDIIDYRESQGFKSRYDLINIKGIGDATFGKIKDYFYSFEGEDTELGLSQPESPTQICINTASGKDLTIIPGIGPVTADRIIEYRDEHGEFSAFEELLEVRGIGPKTLATIKEYAIIGDK